MPSNEVIGGTGGAEYPAIASSVRIEVKADWSSPWVGAEELIWLGGTKYSAGQGLSRIQIRYRYGIVKQPYEFEPSWRQRYELLGYWARVLFDNGTNPEAEIFVGQILNENTICGGNEATVASLDITAKPSGEQVLTAYGGLEHLDKIGIYQSWSEVTHGGTETEKLLDWIPPINQRDRLNTIVGNRSSSTYSNSGEFPATYIYGGTDLWTHKQYIEYILARFVNSLAGPQFALTGATNFLDDMTIGRSITRHAQRTQFTLGSSTTAGEILRTLINPQNGLDFIVEPNGQEGENAGFNIHVFALTGEDHEFEGITLPKNEDLVTVQPTDMPDGVLIDAVQIIGSMEHTYDKIIILGAHVVACCTLRADGEDSEHSGALVPKWTDDLEDEYKNPSVSIGGTEAADYDAYRRNEKFEAVYQIFGPLVNWDHISGKTAPTIDNAGNPLEITDIIDAHFQNAVRDTLPWLPMRKGYDYSVSPPSNSNPVNVESDYRATAAWLYNEEEGKYEGVEHDQIGVHALRNDWGVFLNPNPNHRFALNDFSSAAATDTEPEFDWTKLVVTLAFRNDQRLNVAYVLDQSLEIEANKKTIKIIEVPDAELWYAVPGTIVGVGPTGELEAIHDDNVILRNDADRLYSVMAGAIARYIVERRRSKIPVRELCGFSGLIGKMLSEYTCITGADTDTVEIMAPITGIEWSGEEGSRQTTILCGLTL